VTPQPSAAVLAYQVLDVRDAALDARDLETVARAYAPDAVVIDADRGAIVLRGRAEIREAHARFLDACPRARVEVLDRSYAEQGRIVTDVERVRCDWNEPVQGWVRYEISGGAILRVLKHRSPPFGG
jgi:ketosteroid isomerase-like protein